MNRCSVPAAVLLWFLFSGFAASNAQDAHLIVKRSDRKIRGRSQYAEITMKIVKSDWTREMTMKSWSLGNEYALILITAPAREKGQVTLKRKSEIWNWIPAIGRQIKIPPSMMMQSWMGSDFSNDDLVKESSLVDDYTQKISGDTTLFDAACYKIDLIPKPDAPVVWNKIVLFISKQDTLQREADYYDENGRVVRRMTGDRVTTMGGRLIPTRWVMAPLDKPGEETLLEYRTIEFDISLEQSFFSIQNMKHIR